MCILQKLVDKSDFPRTFGGHSNFSSAESEKSSDAKVLTEALGAK